MENDPLISRLVGHTVAEVERDLILHTLWRHCGSRTRAACMLGLSVRTLRNKIREYAALGIEVPAPRRAELKIAVDEMDSPCANCPAAEHMPTPTLWPSKN